MSHTFAPPLARFTGPARLFTHTLATLLELRAVAAGGRPGPLDDATAGRYLASAVRLVEQQQQDAMRDGREDDAVFLAAAAAFGRDHGGLL